MASKKTTPYPDKEIDRLRKEILKKIEKKVFAPRCKGKPEIYSLKVPVRPVDLLHWLEAQSIHPKIYWCDRKQDLEMAGIGQADLISSRSGTDLPKMFNSVRKSISLAGKSIRYFGGMSFDIQQKNESCWNSFGNFFFLLPRFAIVKQCGETSLVINFHFADSQDFELQRQSLPQDLERIVFQFSGKTVKIPKLLSCKYNPGRTHWNDMIRVALNEIEGGCFEKIVLARQSKFEFAAPLKIFALLHQLQRLDPDNVYFYLQPRAETCFVSATPELLYARQGRNINSEAVAATRLRGKNEQEDQRLQQELLTSPKDIKEHWYVLKSLNDRLSPLCQRLTQQGKTTVLKQARIQHLHAQLKGVLKQNIPDDTIILNLHPTPAVGGFPSQPALARLKALEPFNRGWYAAPVGWISNHSAKFVVAIRSGLICENQMVLFSGAGIVRGSQPQAEWNETNNKIASYLKALRIRDDVNS
jgi:menaquinone-specific isochorismate synthase